MHQRISQLVLAGVTLVAVGCGGREAREEKAGQRPSTASVSPETVNWTAVEQAMGRTGAMQPGDVYKFGLPRGDLTVTVDRIQLKPALALGSCVAFKATSSGAIVMGDLVLRDDEVEPVMAKLAEGGLDVTALHHHVLHETPRVYYMHIHGAGDAIVATALNFQPTGAGNAAITGDFVLRAAEVNPVLRALREHGIEVTAVHNHMLDEQPRLFFMHFWAVGDAVRLAEGLRAALDNVHVKKPSWRQGR